VIESRQFVAVALHSSIPKQQQREGSSYGRLLRSCYGMWQSLRNPAFLAVATCYEGGASAPLLSSIRSSSFSKGSPVLRSRAARCRHRRASVMERGFFDRARTPTHDDHVAIG
jgi:hypothetical protein